jgi:hypothetical protein
MVAHAAVEVASCRAFFEQPSSAIRWVGSLGEARAARSISATTCATKREELESD